MSEIRYDLLQNEYVIMAPNRLTRPNYYSCEEKKENKTELCPFCEGHENLTPPEIYSIKDENGWRVRVVPNLYKALEIEAANGLKEDGLYEKSDGFGAHEIIIDAPKHITHFEELSLLDMKEWFMTAKARVDDLRKDIRLTYFSIFKNQGEHSGATLPHIHTQLIAMPLIPKNQLLLQYHYFDYYKKHGRSVFEDVVDYEREKNKRVILESTNFISFCPYGSRYAFETVVMPKVSISSICSFENDKIEEFLKLLRESLMLLRRQIGEFDYNLLFKNPPMQKNYESEDFFDDIDKFFRFHAVVVPRLYKTGGFEIESQMHINPLLPESAAKLLRETILP